jgi:hypothetical protein
MKSRTILTVLLVLAVAATSWSQRTREVSKSLPFNRDGRVSIDTYKGTLTVTTWDRAQIEIAARVEAADDWWDDGEDAVRLTEIRIDGSESEVFIASDYERLKRRSRGFWSIFDGGSVSLPYVHYTIRMPRTSSLRIKDYKSETHITDLQADLRMNTYKGRVTLTSMGGGVELETYKGDVRVEYIGFGSSSRFETYKGEITIHLPKGRGFDLDARLGSRGTFRTDFDVREERGRSTSKKRRAQEFRSSVNGGGPSLKLETYKGTYRLRES